MKTKSEIFEDLCKYLILGVIGTICIVAIVFFVITLVTKVVTNPLGVLIVLGVGSVFIAIGYGISLAFNALDRYACAKYANTYEKEEVMPEWINRSVTTVEWPFIPDANVKSLIKEYAEFTDRGMNDTFTFESVIDLFESWENEDYTPKVEEIYSFLDKHDLKVNDTIKFWW